MIDLPNPTRPALASFWIVSSLGLGFVLSFSLWVLQIPHALMWAWLAAAAACVPGALHPSLVRRPYDAWNRLSRTARRAARLWLSGVAFLIITVVGRSGTRLPWSEPASGASGWTAKRPLPVGSHRTTADVSKGADSDGWIGSLVRWGHSSANGWVWSLIPVLALLKVVEGKPARSLGGNVYTLY